MELPGEVGERRGEGVRTKTLFGLLLISMQLFSDTLSYKFSSSVSGAAIDPLQ